MRIHCAVHVHKIHSFQSGGRTIVQWNKTQHSVIVILWHVKQQLLQIKQCRPSSVNLELPLVLIKPKQANSQLLLLFKVRAHYTKLQRACTNWGNDVILSKRSVLHIQTQKLMFWKITFWFFHSNGECYIDINNIKWKSVGQRRTRQLTLGPMKFILFLFFSNSFLFFPKFCLFYFDLLDLFFYFYLFIFFTFYAKECVLCV